MDDLGAELKKARESRGLSLSEVAAHTKISVTALEALERNDPSRLPGGIFGRSFVRAYASEVGLDADSVVERFIALLERHEEAEAERRRAMQPEISLDDRQFLERQRRALLAARVVIIIVLFAAIPLIIWGVRAVWPSLTRSSADPAPAATAVAAPPATPAPAVDPASTVSETVDPPASAAAALVIDLELGGECWVSVSIDGKPQTTRLYRSGETTKIEADQQVLLDVGNAGAVRVLINGRPAKPLGAAGAHVRTRITRENVSEFF